MSRAVQLKSKKSSLCIAISLALGGTATGINSLASAATLPNGSVLEFDAGIYTCVANSGTPPDNCYYSTNVKTGSWFGMDGDGNSTIAASEKTAIVMHDGITIGATSTASGSHTGAPFGLAANPDYIGTGPTQTGTNNNGTPNNPGDDFPTYITDGNTNQVIVTTTESPGLDEPWAFFGNTGMDYFKTTAPAVLSEVAADTKKLNFTGWTVTWNAIPTIPMNNDAWSQTGFYSNGGGAVAVANATALLDCASVCANGETYTLDYRATVPDGDPSGFGGVQYQLWLEGTIRSDIAPTAFSFTDITTTASQLVTSDAITVAGVNANPVITVSGGTYQVNNTGPFISTAGNVRSGDTVKVQHTSAASPGTVDTTLTIGGVSDIYTSTVAASNTPPVSDALPDGARANEGATVTLNGTGSTDSDGTITSYAWSQTTGATVTINNNTTDTANFAVPAHNGTGSGNVLTFELAVTDDDGASDATPDTATVTVNEPPTSNAGADQVVNVSGGVTLDGSGSTDGGNDVSGTITAWNWTQTGGTSVTLSGNGTAAPTFTAPGAGATLTFTLEAVDNEGEDSNTDDGVQIIVNEPPVAAAGTDQNVTEGDSVTLDCTGSTDDGTITGFAWSKTAGATVSLTGAATSIATFTAPADSGAITFKCDVTDNYGVADADGDEMTVTVNTIPVADAGTDQSTGNSAAVTLDGTGSSDDGTITACAWTQVLGTTVTLTPGGTAGCMPTFTTGSEETYRFELVVTDDLGASSTNDSTDNTTDDVVVSASSDPKPLADAGTDQRGNETDTITLDGSGSTDNGTITAFTWTQTGPGTSVTLTGNGTASPTFTVPAATGNPGTTDRLTFSLTVTDNNGQNSVSPDTVDVDVNQPPTPNAGPDQTVLGAATVTLDGSSSDDTEDGADSITGSNFAWSQTAGTSVTLSSVNAAMPTFIAPAAPDSLTFELLVTDSEGEVATAADAVIVTVNTPPVADCSPATLTVNEAATVSLDGSGSSDTEDTTVTIFAWSQTGGTSVTLNNPTTATPDFGVPAPDGANDDLTFDLVVTDTAGTPSTVDTCVIHVNNVPVANAGPDQTVEVSTPVTLDGSGSSDPEDTTVTIFAWSQTGGTTVTLTGGTTTAPTFTAPNSATTLMFDLLVTDTLGKVSVADSVTVDVELPNVQPVCDAGPNQTVGTGDTVTIDATGSFDTDGSITAYLWAQNSGTSVTLSSTTTATATFTAPAVDGGTPSNNNLKFRCKVTDEDGAESGEDEVTVQVLPPNVLPTASCGGNQTVTEGATVTLNGSGSSDSDGTITAYAWTQTAGTTVALSSTSATSPTFTAPVPAGASENFTFSLMVTDDRGGSSSAASCTITVNEIPNVIPVANAGPDQTVNQGDSVTLDGSGSTDSDGTITSYTWTQTSGLLVAMSNPTTANPTFTAPALAGPMTFSLVVNDNDGGNSSNSESVTITVNPTSTTTTTSTTSTTTTTPTTSTSTTSTTPTTSSSTTTSTTPTSTTTTTDTTPSVSTTSSTTGSTTSTTPTTSTATTTSTTAGGGVTTTTPSTATSTSTSSTTSVSTTTSTTVPAASTLPADGGDSSKGTLKSSKGTLQIGDSAANAGKTGAEVDADDVTQTGGGIAVDGDVTSSCVGGCFDFIVSGLTPGESVDVVLPLSAPIPNNAVYRKFYLAAWHTFDDSGADALASAAKVGGDCPNPSSGAYTSGLNAGDDCVRMTAADGGPNDADQVADSVFTDPGGVGELPTVAPADSGGGGSFGCTASPVQASVAKAGDWWLIGGFLAWLGSLVRRRSN